MGGSCGEGAAGGPPDTPSMVEPCWDGHRGAGMGTAVLGWGWRCQDRDCGTGMGIMVLGRGSWYWDKGCGARMGIVVVG